MAGRNERFPPSLGDIKAANDETRKLQQEIHATICKLGETAREARASLAKEGPVYNPNGVDVIIEAQEDDLPPFKFRPSIYARGDKKLDVEKVLAIRKVYEEAEAKGARLLRSLNNRPIINGIGRVDDQRRVLNRCAVYALIKEETDKIVAARGLVEPDPRFPPGVVEILEEYYFRSQVPNGAEVHLLASATGLEPGWVVHWFREKHERLKPVRLARAAIPMDGPIGKMMQERFQGKRNTGTDTEPAGN
ncbi:MAG: hypothetical protein M1816_008257 [Peltula sp. TS41687]|nr:MAG: hypothetical protein M1816_008257 [Peltula sp. TS41687]